MDLGILLRSSRSLALFTVLLCMGGAGSLVAQTGLAESEQSTEGTASPVPGLYEDRIVFGQSAAFSGPAASLGNGMHAGIGAAFQEVNLAGGIHGRQLELIRRNDGYEPELAILNARTLIEEDEVFALIGSVGTPTSRAVLPIANAAKVPYIAPFTGAGFLRDPHSYTVNLRASYDQETQRIVSFLTETLELSRIAIVYQDDSYGEVGFAGIQKAMNAIDKSLVGIGTYPRNTLAVKTALLDIRETNPQAVVIIGAYAPTAELILWAKKIDLDAVFITISFVGSQALADALGAQGTGVYVTQVVPTHGSCTLVICGEYEQALHAFDQDLKPGFVSLEGYLAGRMTIDLLEAVGPDVTQDKFMALVRSGGLTDLGGFALQFGTEDNQGSDLVFLTVIDERQLYRAVR